MEQVTIGSGDGQAPSDHNSATNLLNRLNLPAPTRGTVMKVLVYSSKLDLAINQRLVMRKFATDFYDLGRRLSDYSSCLDVNDQRRVRKQIAFTHDLTQDPLTADLVGKTLKIIDSGGPNLETDAARHALLHSLKSELSLTLNSQRVSEMLLFGEGFLGVRISGSRDTFRHSPRKSNEKAVPPVALSEKQIGIWIRRLSIPAFVLVAGCIFAVTDNRFILSSFAALYPEDTADDISRAYAHFYINRFFYGTSPGSFPFYMLDDCSFLRAENGSAVKCKYGRVVESSFGKSSTGAYSWIKKRDCGVRNVIATPLWGSFDSDGKACRSL